MPKNDPHRGHRAAPPGSGLGAQRSQRAVLPSRRLGQAGVVLVVPGAPVPKGRPRVVRAAGRGAVRAFTPERTRAWENEIAWAWRQAAGTLLPDPEGQFVVDARFFLPTRRAVDVDNLVKSLLDALNGIAWVDDSHVVAVRAVKQLDRERPRVEAWVREAPPGGVPMPSWDALRAMAGVLDPDSGGER